MTKLEIEKNLYKQTIDSQSYFEHLIFMYRSGALKKAEFKQCVTNVYTSLQKHLNTILEQNVITSENNFAINLQNLINNMKKYLADYIIKKPKNFFNEIINNL